MPRPEPISLARLVAHVVQNFPITPAQAAQMTPVELALYTLPTSEDSADAGTTIALVDALEQLTYVQRAELRRRQYS